MGMHRGDSWKDIAKPDEHLAAFLELDEALETFLEDIEPFSPYTYDIHTDRGSVDRMSRMHVSEAVDSLGGSLERLQVGYRNTDGSCRVLFSTQPLLGVEDNVTCFLNVFGDEDLETNGLFETLRNRMDAQIQRHWPPVAKQVAKSAPPKQETAPPSATAPRVGGFKKWLDGVLRHPIVAPLVVVGVLALIGGLWKLYSG
jgi:hypothetical protein